MNVKYSAELATGVLTAVLVTEENIAAAAALIPQIVVDDIKPEASFAEEGKINYYLTANHKYFFVGLGKGVQSAAFPIEKLRRALTTVISTALAQKVEALQIIAVGLPFTDAVLAAKALGEVPILAGYQFLPYKTDKKVKYALADVHIYTDLQDAKALIRESVVVAKATTLVRDLVNEPPNVLTATELAKRAEQTGKEYGFKVEVLEKKKIESLKMGGLLAVNKGSNEPPTFSILEWKPKKAKNDKPIIIVGKGLVFDTGGLSLKPTAGSMDSMKCDMAGGAVVIGLLAALAKNEVPLHVVGLIPSTDNRPGEDAYTPNDVITMYNGMTVEVLNTDAEGRLILADALAYAKKYQPELVIDLATLTGAAVIAVGPQAATMMSTADAATTQRIIESGNRTYERLVQMPLWEDYDELLQSDIADMKNIGGRYAGTITAAKFLQRFTDYPWIHLDIAGPAFLEKSDSYRGKNGSGFGVRLLYDFLTTDSRA